MIVAKESWEPRNAQDFVRGVPDLMWVEKPRPEGTDNFSLAPVASPVAWLTYLGSDGALYPITANGAIIIRVVTYGPNDPSAG